MGLISLIVLVAVDFSSQRIVAMNCSECIKQCVSVTGKSVKIASTLDLGVSFVSNIFRAFVEDQSPIKGVRKIYSPLSWVENKWVRIVSNLFLVFPAFNIFCADYELLFACLGAIPAYSLALSTIGDGIGYVCAKKGWYKELWKSCAANQLSNDHQQDAADWVNNLPK